MPMATPIGVVSEKKSAIATIDLRRNLACDEEKNFVATLVKHCFIIGITQVFLALWVASRFKIQSKDKNHK
jgi:hypothetical protein